MSRVGFVFRMAWRDSRAARRRLFLFSTSVVLGIAALVALTAIKQNLRSEIDDQARGLLGADLAVTTRADFTPEVNQWLDGLGGEVSRETSLSSMVVFPASGGGTRLVDVRAIEGGFPFYGDFQTAPAGARDLIKGDGAVVEESLLEQFGAKVGDPLKVGTSTFRIVAALEKVPGESAAITLLAPRVYIPADKLAGTGLLGRGSLVRHRAYVKLPAGTDADAFVQRERPKLREMRLRVDTIEERKRDLGNALQNVYAFLGLVALAALFLGAIGVATAVHLHVRSRIPTVAVLRCLGASASTAFGVYLVQGLALGLAGAGVGTAIGVAVQGLLPRLLHGMLPVELTFRPAWDAMALGLGAGLLVSVLFTLLPLLGVRRISPLMALRAAGGLRNDRRDPLRWLVYAAITGVVVLFSVTQARRPREGIGFAVAIAVTVLVLAGLARVVAWVVRRWTPRTLPYVWRQGLANLHRPNNRTVLLLLALGLGTLFVLTLQLARATLMAQIESVGGADRPNLLFFDVQDEQVSGIRERLGVAGLADPLEAPIVAMKLAEWKGRPVAEVNNDPAVHLPGWALRRDYRSTFRETLSDTEKITAGKWVGRVTADMDPVPVSLEEGLARELQLKIGDTLTFDVQGLPIRTQVASLRSVEWRRMAPNFFVVFPAGVLEAAPKFHIMAVRAKSTQQSAAIQRDVIAKYPNVSAIDLALVISTVDGIFDKIAVVVRLLALFTAGTGLLVLAGAIITGRYERVRETVLLRTLGATHRQVTAILLVEYGVLGALAALTGMGLAVGANILLSKYVFEVAASNPPGLLAGTVVVVSSATLLVGWLGNRGVADSPPLVVLREEG